MDSKILNYFKQFIVEGAKVLSSDEFDTISGYCEFDITMPDINQPDVIIDITTTQVMPTDIYAKLVNCSISGLNIRVKSNNLSNDYSNLYEYITKWVKKYHANSYVLLELLNPTNSSVDKGVLTVKYVSNGEMEDVKKIEKELINFLNKANFDVSKIVYVVNTEKINKLLEKENERRKTVDAMIAKVQQENTDEEIWKRKYRTVGKITPMNTITNESAGSFMYISGEIISWEEKPLKNKDIIRYEFSLYDYNMGALKCSYRINLSPEKKPYKPKYDPMPTGYLKTFKVGDWINAFIKVECNEFNKYVPTGNVYRMSKIDKPEWMKPKDDAKEKRVELLAHSNYCAYDGLDSAPAVYKHAKALNHSALAAIDRHNVQAFPDIENLVNDTSVKKIFGIELEMIEDMIPVCINPHGQNLEKANYVIFDIETTGLYPEYEDLIEFGAIKWEKGQVSNNIDFFVKPTKPLTNVAINMSHITEDMVANAISQKEALLKIKEYIGDSILIAHNGIRFDLNFLNKLCERFGVEPINNTLIDTLEISHSLNKQMTRHNLGTLTRKLKIDYNELIAHRADKDAEYLLSVWKYFLKRLIQEGIVNVDDINKKLNNETLKANRRGYFVDIYAKNQNGIKALYKLITLASTKQMYLRDAEGSKLIANPKIHYSNLEPYRNDLVICPHPMDGEIWESALNDTQENFEKKMKKYDYIFVSPFKNFGHLVHREEISKSNVLKTLNKIVETANKLGIKPCAVSDAYYCMEYEKQFHEIFVWIPQLGNKPHWLYRYDHNIFVPDFHFMTTQQMLDAFDFIKDKKVIKDLVVSNTNYFANSIEVTKPIKKLRPNAKGVPKYPYSPKIEGCEKFLTDVVYARANELWPDGLPEPVKARIEKELNAIISNGYAVVYWISRLLVLKSISDGYLVGSRGSVGSSVVAFLSGISEVNPLPPYYYCKKCHHYETYPDVTVDGFDLPKKKCPVCGQEMYSDGHNIPFESFLGQDCDKIPDIDLNFSGEYQAKAHKFIKDMFGPLHSFRAGTVSTVAYKTAYGYVKKYFELTDPNNAHSEALVDALAKKCTGVKKTTGQHPGGIVVVPLDMDLEDFCPSQYPSNDLSNDWNTTHFDYHQMNEVLLKFDILGHDEPTILNHLQKLTGIDPRTIPNFDDKVLQLFANSKGIGIVDENFDIEQLATDALPEFGTPATKKIINDTKPTGVGDLIKISGLAHGKGVWQGNADKLVKDGAKLSQVICCREDIVDYLNKCGLDFMTAFKATESIRKGKGVKPDHEQAMIKAKVPSWYIDSCKTIEYLFPKAHATAYVLDAIRTAWYKVYYPVQFYAVWLSIRTDKAFDIATIKEGKDAVTAKIKDIKTKIAKRDPSLQTKEEELLPILEVCLEMFARGIRMLNIDLNKSLAYDFICEGNNLIPPFIALDGLGAEAAKSIVEARKVKPFSSIDDLMNRTKLSTTLINKLKDLHVLDNLDDDDQMRLF